MYVAKHVRYTYVGFTKCYDKIFEQMEDDKRDLVAKLEAMTKETEKAKQALENEHQKTLEQMNVCI